MPIFSAFLRPSGRLVLFLAAILFWWVPAVLAGQTETPAEAQSNSGLLINEIMAANVSTVIDPDFGVFPDWIELYNPGDDAVDLSNFSLTDDIRDPVKWLVPPGTLLPANEYLLIWADGRDSGLHSSFRLSRDGEEVALYDREGRLLDMVRFGDQVEDVSYGRTVDGAAEWVFFQQPTPGRLNDGETLPSTKQAPAPEFSLPGGRYQTPLELSLSSTSPAAEIRYTLDGSSPTRDSALYQEPIQLAKTAVVRARAFVQGLLSSPITTHTYLIREQTQLPIVSLVTDPAFLWDPETGIYVDEEVEKRKDWERPATVALYEPDGSSGFQAEASIRLFGRSAIHLPQKSLSVFIQDAGGDQTLHYPLFLDRDLEEYSAFLLRSGSDDWAGAMLRDGFGQQILEGELNLGTQAFRPALLFVNGSYFGIHNIREKENEDYLVTHYGVDLDELDLLFVGYSHGDGSTDLNVLYGDAGDYERLVEFALSHDLTAPENYSVLQANLNTDHFIDYIIAESYAGNTSWHRNRKVWRAQAPLDRWDFLIYDLDRGFGRRYTNTLQDILGLDPLFGALLSNQDFKNQFVQRFAHRLNVTFKPERLLTILDLLQENIAPEIDRQREYWTVEEWWAENYETEAQISGRDLPPELPAWQDEIAHLQQFVLERPDALRQHIVEAFSLSGTQFLTIEVNRPEGGHILVEGLPLPGTPFTGVYFRDIPLKLTAVAEPGFRFVSWQGPVSSREETVSLELTGDESITAVFELERSPIPWLGPVQPYGWVAGLILLVILAVLLQLARP
ncbi:MAG: CotH kinase family protein [Candidatus Promineifilaceae bacterium]